jgi:diguanylate cyclase (GGDEF)-like protein
MAETAFSILVVDDNPDNFDVISTFLEPLNYSLHYADSGLDAIAHLDILQPDLILLDVMMPEVDGIEVCRRIKAMPQWRRVPIIIVTALTATKDLATCLAAGADDFVTKPVNRLELTARVQSMLRIREQYLQLESFNIRLEAEVRKRTEDLQKMVLRDELTQLPSRTGLLVSVQAESPTTATSIALIYLDCDDFKVINTSLGHTVGNQLLKAIAERLKQHLGPQDLLARMGEDEFCFKMQAISSPAIAEQLARQLLSSFETPFVIAGREIFITTCIGIAIDSTHQQPADALLQNAETAMYQAKLQGRGHYQLFDQRMQLAIAHRLTLENDLKRALEEHTFINYYQPIVDLHTQQVVAFEALVRLWHPQRGMISPGEFIPCLEQTGLIIPVGICVLKQACRQLRYWHQCGWPDLKMSVNFSTRQFASPTLLADIDRVLTETQVNPACLQLEITESAIMENAEAAIAITEQLRSRQIQISIDDFGTGYSSLGYLHRFPLNTLKIDRSFVSGQEACQRNVPVIETILTLSQQLGLSVVAEGIECREQVAWLQRIGCQYGQGYFFSKPLPAEAVADRYLQPHPDPIANC